MKIRNNLSTRKLKKFLKGDCIKILVPTDGSDYAMKAVNKAEAQKAIDRAEEVFDRKGITV